MELFFLAASFLIFPVSLVFFMGVTRSWMWGHAVLRLFVYCVAGVALHYRLSPFFINSDADYYIKTSGQIHTGSFSPGQIISEQKALWPAVISPLNFFDFFDFEALVIGLAATLLTIASLRVLTVGRDFRMRGLIVLEPVLFSMSAPVVFFGPSPLRESLFWLGLVLVGTGVFKLLSTQILDWSTSGTIILGSIAASIARIELGAIAVVWANVISVALVWALSKWRVSLAVVAQLIVGSALLTYFVFIVFSFLWVGSVGNDVGTAVGVVSKSIVDIQSSGQAESTYLEGDDYSPGRFLAASLLTFFFGLSSPGAGAAFNLLSSLSFISWILVVLGVIFFLVLGKKHFVFLKRLAFIIGPLAMSILVILMIDNLGTLIRFRVSIVSLVILFSLQGWSYFLCSPKLERFWRDHVLFFLPGTSVVR